MNFLGGFVLLQLLLVSSDAFAYLDPGSVSLGLQAFLAALAAAALFWKYWYWKVLSFLGLKNAKKRSQEIEEQNSQQERDDE